MNTELVERLKNIALEAGASDVQVISTDKIVVDEKLGEICGESRCPWYGSAPSCPPHAMKPSEFKELLDEYRMALVLKFDIPMSVVYSEEGPGLNRHLHEMLTVLEKTAVDAGFTRSRGFAGGSCKRLYCDSDEICEVLTGGECKYPDLSRPSASGLGVNFNELNKALGWEGASSGQNETGGESHSMMEAILLLG